MTSDTLTEPGPPPPPPNTQPQPSRSDRFFSWTAGLGVVRGDGWIGGVAAGVAARLRIDPLIVRGVVIVIGLFGFPVMVLYGLAWALLPDLDGRIPARDLQRSRVTPAVVGAAAFVLVGLLPAPIVFALGLPPFWLPGSGGTGAFVMLMLTVAVIASALLIFLIVRATRRTPGETVSDLRTASADDTAPDTPADDTASGAVVDADGPIPDAAHHRVAASGIALSPPDAERPADLDDPAPEPADDDEIERWRAQHAAWKEQDQLWRQQQQDAVRIAREQARRERQARATAFAAEAAERRRQRRAVNPRTPLSYLTVAIGVALVAGTVTALQQGGSMAAAVGLFVAALALAIAMVLAGVLRRRSGFLAFLTTLTILGAFGAAAYPTAVALHAGDYSLSNIGAARYPASAPFVQPWGNASVLLLDTGAEGETHIRKRTGSTFITLMPGVALDVEVTTASAAVLVSGTQEADGIPWSELATWPGTTRQTLPDGRTRLTATVINGDEPATTRERLVIDQEWGYVEIYVQHDTADDGANADDETADDEGAQR